MKKLSLDPESLQVQSFQTTSLTAGRGTVRGLQTENPAISACWGTGCGSGDVGCGGLSGRTDPMDSCGTYTQGGDETCINCTYRAGTCTGGDYCNEQNTLFACTPPSCVQQC